jgi:small-conductance mechanosensitive channel
LLKLNGWWLQRLSDRFAQINGDSADRELDFISEVTLDKIAIALFVIVVAYGLVQLSEKSLNWFSEKVPSRFRLVVKQSVPFWRALIIFTAVVIGLNLFVEFSPNNLLALTGTIAVALGFAFKDYISSLIAGVVALFEVPYRVGDRVQIGEHYGEIVSYGLRDIRLQTPADNMVTIPHNKIWTEAVSNANDGALEAQVVTDFHFAHGIDIDAAMRILYQAAYTSKFTQLKLPVTVVIEDKPWGTLCQLKSYPMDIRDEFLYKTDLLRRAKQAIAKHKLAYPELPSFEQSEG